MADQLSLRGGTTAEHATFTGANKEVTVDTTKKTLVVNDGATVGGHPLMRENASNSALALGSAGTPSLKFTGDTNTGIYSPGADQLAVATNGTGRLFIDASGRVGVGISPGNTLHVNGTSRFEDYLYGTTANGILYVNDDLSVTAGKKFYLDSGSNTYVHEVSSDVIAVVTGANERLRITSAGLVGIGVTSPDQALSVKGLISTKASDGATRGLVGSPSWDESKIAIQNGSLAQSFTNAALHQDVVGNTVLNSAASYATQFCIGGSERARIDSSGRLLVGTSSTRSNLFNGNSAVPAYGLIEGANDNGKRVSGLVYGSAAPFPAGPILVLAAHNSNSIGGVTAVTNNGELARISFQGADGTNFVEAAKIEAFVDGTPGAGDMPCRIVLSTTAAGAATPTERMRITSTGQVRLAGAGITFNGDTAAANELDDYEEGTWTVSFFDAVTGGNASATTDTGYYTKIGDRVICNFTTSNIDTTGMTGANNLFFTLPFTSSASKGVHFGSCALENINANDASITIAASVNASVARGYLLGSVDNAGFSAIIVSNLTSTAADVWVSITYAA